MHRYAIYFAPPREHPLWHAGCALLGRDPETGELITQLGLADISSERFAIITDEARRYGWHGTLKPPFALAEGTDVAMLEAALTRFCASQAPFPMPKLMLADLKGFLAVVPQEPSEALESLAARCVSTFDAFRRPASEAELAKRRRSGLDAVEEANLISWGYPYVMERFRFHMTLTMRMAEEERATVAAALAPLLTEALAAPLIVDAIALYGEASAGAPFCLLRRYAFGG
jgi:putative phosphonate metabolism protein